jgi:hypothetical protein
MHVNTQLRWWSVIHVLFPFLEKEKNLHNEFITKLQEKLCYVKLRHFV